VQQLGCFKTEERGSGLKTPLLASVLAWLYKNANPEEPLLVAANTFGSDTDTIATMAGALIGAVAERSPSVEIQDSVYIAEEARRVYRLGVGVRQPSFRYPDLLTWTPPKNQSDAWMHEGEKSTLKGLGSLSLLGDPFFATKGNELAWQWCVLRFGQTVLAKRRANVSRVHQASTPRQNPEPKQATFASEFGAEPRATRPQISALRIDEATQACIKSAFDSTIVGENLLALAQGKDGIEKAIAFAAIIAKAKIARDAK
jgi:hypothetical protein